MNLTSHIWIILLGVTLAGIIAITPAFAQDYKTISGVGKDVGDGTKTYDVQYSSVKNIVSSSVDTKDKSVNFVLDGKVDTNSILILKLPTGLISGPFIGVLEDGQIITNYIATAEAGDTMVSIPISPLTANVSIVGTSVYSQSSPAPTPITVSTDKNAYLLGDSIVISGRAYPVSDIPISIQVLDPSNNPVGIYQTNVNLDGTYSVTIYAGGPMWNTSGTYTVLTTYKEQGNTAQTSFTFTALVTATGVSQVQVPTSQQTFSVSYDISGGTVNGISADLKSLSLSVSINSNSDGSITLRIPRQLLDSKTNSGQDAVFIILKDGAEVKPQNEQKRGTSRIVTISFLKGDKDIEIIGTEFPSLSGNLTPTLQSNPSQSNAIQKIPSWVRNVFIWYGQGKISEDDLLGAIKFLVDSGIIQLQSK